MIWIRASDWPVWPAINRFVIGLFTVMHLVFRNFVFTILLSNKPIFVVVLNFRYFIMYVKLVCNFLRVDYGYWDINNKSIFIQMFPGSCCWSGIPLNG